MDSILHKVEEHEEGGLLCVSWSVGGVGPGSKRLLCCSLMWVDACVDVWRMQGKITMDVALDIIDCYRRGAR